MDSDMDIYLDDILDEISRNNMNASVATVTEDPNIVDNAVTNNELKEKDLLPEQDGTIDMKDENIDDSNVWKFTMFVFCRHCSFIISQYIFLCMFPSEYVNIRKPKFDQHHYTYSEN